MPVPNCLQSPELSAQLSAALDGLGFTGIDASQGISLFEYAGLYSDKYEVALLCDPQSPYRCIVMEIPKDDIRAELEAVDRGFFNYIDSTKTKEMGLENPMHILLSLFQWCGGFHLNSPQWRPFADWEEQDLISALEGACLKIKNEN